MFNNLHKGLFAALLTIVIIVSTLVVIGIFKGEAILFAITNEQQTLAEKARWNAYIESYGVVEVGKAQ